MSRRKAKVRFLDAYADGAALAEEIDDYVDTWHAHPDGEDLYEFLGMTKREYSLWVTNPDALPHIIRARMQKRPLRDVLDEIIHEMPIAARTTDTKKITRLRKWLATQNGKS